MLIAVAGFLRLFLFGSDFLQAAAAHFVCSRVGPEFLIHVLHGANVRNDPQ